MASLSIENLQPIAQAKCPMGTVLIERKFGDTRKGWVGSVLTQDALITDGVAELNVMQTFWSFNGFLLGRAAGEIIQVEGNVRGAPPLLQRMGASAVCGAANDHVGIFFNPVEVAAHRDLSSRMLPNQSGETPDGIVLNGLNHFRGQASLKSARDLIHDESVIAAIEVFHDMNQ